MFREILTRAATIRGVSLNLANYFEAIQGIGVRSTSCGKL
jgi:hypothetical protein